MINSVEGSEFSKEIQAFLSGGGTLAEIYALSPTTLETLYHAGFRHYSAGSYEDAEKIFRFLCTFDHLNVKHFFALGSCLQMKRQYQAAVDAYSVAGVIDCYDPRPPYYAAECYLMLGRRKEAASGFFAASQLKGKHSQFDKLCSDAAIRYQQIESAL